MSDRILIAFDGSEPAERAIACAASIMQKQRGTPRCGVRVSYR